MLMHAKHSTRANAIGIQYVQVHALLPYMQAHADTLPALDTHRHTQIHEEHERAIMDETRLAFMLSYVTMIFTADIQPSKACPSLSIWQVHIKHGYTFSKNFNDSAIDFQDAPPETS
jgi:hypothetical protein